MKKIIIIMLSFFLATGAYADVKLQVVEYQQGDTALEGWIVYDDSLQGKRPGVVVVHDWMGVSDYAKMRAEKLAQLGYVAFVADIYGKDVRPQNTDEAAAQAGMYKSDRPLMRARAESALKMLQQNPLVDSGRIAGIGYCFGGSVVLEMARAGMDVNGVVSFHGGLSTPMPAATIKPKVLVLHGADDPYVPPDEVKAFQQEMKSAGADWQMVYYSGAVHSFTRPDAGSDVSKGVAYNKMADERSWKAMRQFFDEIF